MKPNPDAVAAASDASGSNNEISWQLQASSYLSSYPNESEAFRINNQIRPSLRLRQGWIGGFGEISGPANHFAFALAAELGKDLSNGVSEN